MTTDQTPTLPAPGDTEPTVSPPEPTRRPTLLEMAALSRLSDARRDADTRLAYSRMSRSARRRFSGDD